MTLDELAEKVAKNESVINCTDEEKRNRVIESGRMIKEIQAEQKRQREETGETWEEWVEAEQKSSGGAFPGRQCCSRYMLISTYPDAYRLGMSVQQAYSEAGRWKANGGVDPGPIRVVPKAIPVALQATLGKVTRAMHFRQVREAPHDECRW